MHSVITRFISLGLAMSLSTVIFIYPFALVSEDGKLQHGLLLILLVAISIGFFHGVGFTPHASVLRKLLGPLLCWPIMLWGLYLLIH